MTKKLFDRLTREAVADLRLRGKARAEYEERARRAAILAARLRNAVPG